MFWLDFMLRITAKFALNSRDLPTGFVKPDSRAGQVSSWNGPLYRAFLTASSTSCPQRQDGYVLSLVDAQGTQVLTLKTRLSTLDAA